MENLYIGEILEKISDPNMKRVEKMSFLRAHATEALLTVLRGMFDKNLQFFTDTLPPFKPDDSPIGMNGMSLYKTYRIFYVWLKQHPADDNKKRKILIQHLETLNPKEIKVLECILKKTSKYSGVTEKLIRETFPGLFDNPAIKKVYREIPNAE